MTTALSFKEFDKYECLTGENLGYKPDVIQRAKFEHSPLDEAFNKVFKNMIKIKKSINTTMIYFMTLCIILIHTVCLILMKYHQWTLSLIQ